MLKLHGDVGWAVVVEPQQLDHTTQRERCGFGMGIEYKYDKYGELFLHIISGFGVWVSGIG